MCVCLCPSIVPVFACRDAGLHLCKRVWVCMCVYVCWKATRLERSSSAPYTCQRKLWSEEAANRAWCTSPETKIIGNRETTAGRHLPGSAIKVFQSLLGSAPLPSPRPSFPCRPKREPPLASAASARVSGLLTVTSELQELLTSMQTLLKPPSDGIHRHKWELAKSHLMPYQKLIWNRKDDNLNICRVLMQKPCSHLVSLILSQVHKRDTLPFTPDFYTVSLLSPLTQFSNVWLYMDWCWIPLFYTVKASTIFMIYKI